jgi:two-component system, OmpR family, phosphate regulon sensor histidine kinase PhoR
MEEKMSKAQTLWLQYNKFPTAKPDDARRGRLLNLLLAGSFVLGILSFIVVFVILYVNSSWDKPGNSLILATLGVGIAGILALFFVNQFSVRYASFLFLLLLTVAFSFSDTPAELSNGRSSFVFFIPIAVSSLLLTPASSFLFAIGGSLIMAWFAHMGGVSINIPTITGCFMLALVSWLSARSLDQALNELRGINLNLDKLVEQKTEELATTLAREIVLAGRNQAILDSIADGVIVFDANRTSILANPALSKIIETPIENLKGINLTDFIKTRELSPTSQGMIMGMIEDPDKIKTSVQVEWGKKTLAVSVARVRNSETNQAIGAVAVIRDVTREAELEKMKSTFVAVVSHELRTPLNAIMGYAEMLKEAVYGAINEKQVAATVRIMVNTQRLLTMVGDLLDEAQIKAGKLSLTKQLFKTSSLLEVMHATMDKIATDKGLTLTDEIDLNMPNTITGDARRLQQVLINLVNNSAKFTEKGGIHARILLSDPNHWAIEVTDTGVGISKEEIPYIFDSFRQVENSTIRKHGGFGLGLAIVKQLVELMKGEITVNSELGKGSTFIINLPLENNS